ncbi:MAG: methyltransferase domain-containing protein, partial [bacterium]|nr:methyltransferase domain-containing protein [bacterium]
MDIREQMDNIYRDLPLDSVPWNMTEPPPLLVEAVETGKIEPCEVVDLGCGAGNYSIWLAQKGFHVTGLDISVEAIAKARALASEAGVCCRFEAVSLLDDLSRHASSFDLAIDWEVLHHVFPADRECFVRNVHSILKPGGTYFSLSFSEDDPAFGGEGKFRDTPLGTKLYFSSEEELRKLFSPSFEILDLRTIEIPGKYGPHTANAVWLKR